MTVPTASVGEEPRHTDDVATLSDAELVRLTRDGVDAAFRELWNRHMGAGLRMARQITRRYDAEDLVQEAFTRTLAAIRGGRGPESAFRPYLYATIRNVSMKWTDDVESQAIDSLAHHPDPDSIFEDVVLDRSIVGRAFASLRHEWQAILWYTEVEGLSSSEAATYLGLTPGAAAALAYRARNQLRTAWVQAHVSNEAVEPQCRWSVVRMGTYKRNQLGAADTKKMERHLADCESCATLAADLDEASHRVRAVLVPLIGGPLLAAHSLMGDTAAAATLPASAVTGSGIGPAPTGGRPSHARPRAGRWLWPVQRVLVVLVATVGAAVLVYPTVASWYTGRVHATQVAGYVEQVANLPDEEISRELAAAHEYNEHLPEGPLRDPYALSVAGQQTAIGQGARAYFAALDVGGDGMMGRLNIPKIDVDLPIFHGTDEATLAKGIGHLYGSSLPVGGEGTHAVLTGHSGFVTATLLTQLDKLEIGDRFTITVLDTVLTYQVDQVSTVTPEQTQDLLRVPGEDYVTLVTCTPTGVNTHRLLVRGERVPTPPEVVDGVQWMTPPSGPVFPWWALTVGVVPYSVAVLTRPRAVRSARASRSARATAARNARTSRTSRSARAQKRH